MTYDDVNTYISHSPFGHRICVKSHLCGFFEVSAPETHFRKNGGSKRGMRPIQRVLQPEDANYTTCAEKTARKERQEVALLF